MHSATTGTSSTNDFAVARAGLLGLGVGAADSQGVAGQAGACQTSAGGANTANVATSTGAVAQVAKSTSTSKSCKGVAPEVTQTSQVIGLGGTGVALPAAGCANGTPDTQAGLPGLLPIICNAEELVGNNAAVREALDVFALQVGSNAVLKETTAASESLSVAPEGGTQCSDGVDNDGDGLIDDLDGGCHSDGNPANPNSYVPSDNDESDGTGTGSGTGTGNGDDGRATTAPATTAATRSAPTAVTTTATASSTRTIRAVTRATTSTTRTTPTTTPRAATAAAAATAAPATSTRALCRSPAPTSSGSRWPVCSSWRAACCCAAGRM